MSQCEPEGNTKTSGPCTKKSNNNQAYRWSFTLKAYVGEPCEPNDPNFILPIQIHENLCKFSREYVYQLERSDTGYLHYQGCFSLIQKHRMSEVKNILGWNEVHLEQVVNWHALKNYCSKKDTRVSGPYTNATSWVKTIEVLYPWQQEIIDIMKGPVDDRAIYWFWEPLGNVGKTSFCKYCAVRMGATIIRGGALKDIAYTIPDHPDVIIFDIPRTNEDRVNYEAIESCKDGMVFSAKYESKMKIFNSPHVIIFANFEPEYENLSLDRWKVSKIKRHNAL